MKSSIKWISIFAGILVGILVMAQFKTATPLGSSYAVDQIEAQKELIKSYINEEAALKNRIGNLREKIDKSLEENQLISQASNLETLNNLKAEIGLTELKGRGFTIDLNDSLYIDRENIDDEEPGIVYASDIRDIVNLLRTMDIEGISINNQRIIATSSINSVGNTLLVNNSHLAPPFSISVLGDYETFLIRIYDPNVLADLKKRVKENGIQMSHYEVPHIVLPIYNGQFRLKFINNTDEATN